jgi:hypothetical protein
MNKYVNMIQGKKRIHFFDNITYKMKHSSDDDDDSDDSEYNINNNDNGA